MIKRINRHELLTMLWVIFSVLAVVEAFAPPPSYYYYCPIGLSSSSQCAYLRTVQNGKPLQFETRQQRWRNKNLALVMTTRDDADGGGGGERTDTSGGGASPFSSTTQTAAAATNATLTNNNVILGDDAETNQTTTQPAIQPSPEAIQEAEEYRRRARELLAEARGLERSLEETRSAQQQQKESDVADLTNRLFQKNRPLTAAAVARVLREERWSVEQLELVLESLYQRQKEAAISTLGGGTEATSEDEDGSLSTAPANMIPEPKTFQIASTDNAAVEANQTEFELMKTYTQCILDAAAILDQEREPNDRPAPSTAASSSSSNNANITATSPLATDSINTRWSGRGVAALNARLNEWRRTDEENFRRRLAMDVNAAMLNSNTSVQDYMRQTLGLAPVNAAGGANPTTTPPVPTENQSQNNNNNNPQQVNATNGSEQQRVARVPLWVPSSLVRYMIAARAVLAAEDVKAIKDKVLSASRFYCTEVESIPGAAIFRGNIRQKGGAAVASATDDGSSSPNNTTAAVATELEQLLKLHELNSRVQLFLMEDPEWRPNRDERETKPKPVVLALPAAVVPDDSQLEQTRTQVIGKKVSAVLAAATTFVYSVSCYALNPQFFNSIVQQRDLKVLTACLPVFFGVTAVTAVHEAAHWLMARWRGIKIGTPIPVPSTQFGTFGCITPFRSFPANRAAVLDFALSGPVAAIAVSVLLMVFGIHQTVHASTVALSHFPVVPIAVLKSSFLAGSILTLLAPKVMMLPISQPIPIHPLFMVGFSGMIVSALNLLPIFRLDGGRACTAAMGPRFGAIASAWTMLFLLSVGLSGSTGLAWAWGLVVAFFQRRPEIPPRDDATEVDDFRLGAWIVSLVTSVLTLAPFPGGPGLL